MSSIMPTGKTLFESTRHVDDQGNEYWNARELGAILGYKTNYRNFIAAVERAKKACEGSGNQVSDHFAETRNMVTIGSGAKREVDDYLLTRYACYLIAQNSDPAKQIVAQAQTYFAIQTRRQEEDDAETFDDPEAAFEEWKIRAIRSFMSKGYSLAYATNRVDSILSRKNIRGKWIAIDITEEEIGILTDQMHMGTFGLSVDSHKALKGFPEMREGTITKHKGNLRPAMTPMEMAVLTFAENVTVALHDQRDTRGFVAASRDVDDGSAIAKDKRLDIERITGVPVVSSRNMLKSPDGGIFGDLGPAAEQQPKEGC